MSQSAHLAGVSWPRRASLRTWVDVWSAVHSLRTPPFQSYSRARHQRCQTGQRFPQGEYSARSWPWSFGWRPKWCPEMKQIPRVNLWSVIFLTLPKKNVWSQVLTSRKKLDISFGLFTRKTTGWREDRWKTYTERVSEHESGLNFEQSKTKAIL